MEIEQNTISRDWTVTHEGRRFFVNFTESDGQALALCNRENWQIHEETEDGVEEFEAYVLSSSSPQEEQQAQENAAMIDELIVFCIRNWDNWFMVELRKDLEEQRRRLEG
jgi:hypothetical protein